MPEVTTSGPRDPLPAPDRGVLPHHAAPGLVAPLYAALTTLAAPGLRAMLAWRARRGKEIPERLPERRGWGAARPEGRLVWLHAASVGETMSILPVLVAARAARPDVALLVTTGTRTSAALLERRLPELGLAGGVLHRFVPLDVPAWVGRFLDRWHPDAAGFVESEIWPNLLAGARRRGVPLMLVNGRLSVRSFAGWRRVPGLAASCFGSFATVQAQSADDAARLSELGAPVACALGNLKFAAPPLPVPVAELAALRARLSGRPVWLAASTHPGEEGEIAAAHLALATRMPGLLTIVVPRHPERGAAVAAEFAARNAPVGLRSRADAMPEQAGFYVADTLGELGLFYAVAPVAFIGGSLIPHGGQNPLEPARLGSVPVVGPHTHNFAEPIARLAAAGALVQVAGGEGLPTTVAALLGDPVRLASMRAAGQRAANADADLPDRVARMLLAPVP